MVQHQKQSPLLFLPPLEIHSPRQRSSFQIHPPLRLLRVLRHHPHLLLFGHPSQIHFLPSHSSSTSDPYLPLLIPLLPFPVFSLPVPQPDRLVMLQHRLHCFPHSFSSYPCPHLQHHTLVEVLHLLQLLFEKPFLDRRQRHLSPRSHTFSFRSSDLLLPYSFLPLLSTLLPRSASCYLRQFRQRPLLEDLLHRHF